MQRVKQMGTCYLIKSVPETENKNKNNCSYACN